VFWSLRSAGSSRAGLAHFGRGSPLSGIIRLSPWRCDRPQPRVPFAEIQEFAEQSKPCKDSSMQEHHRQKPLIISVSLMAAGVILLANAWAQQTPATNTPQAPAAKAAPAPAAGTQTAPVAKTGQATKPKTALTLKTPKDKASYAVGLNVGRNLGAQLRQQSVEVDQAILLRGVKDALAGGKTLMTDDEAKAALTQLQAEIRTRQQEKMKVEQEKMKAVAETNKKQGLEYLEANKSNDGVVALPSGLQYKILTEGTGPKPVATDTIVCNYRGTLIDGTEFDSSYKRGQPLTIGANRVIKGWTEALQLMQVGSKWQLFIPSDLGYGDGGKPPIIGPGATLIFEVELLSIQGKDKSAEAPTK
jgi:FKBP-type peptidyl-prolyl cis-trans isomerase FklB